MSNANLIASLTPASNGSHQETARILRSVVAQGNGTIAAPTGGSTTDAEARTAINAIITALRAKGLIV
jgi:hypothetical protein